MVCAGPIGSTDYCNNLKICPDWSKENIMKR